VQELGGLLTDEASRPQAMKIVRGLIERIEVALGEAGGKGSVTHYGALASILDFAMGATHAKATADGGLCRVFMVAGAHSQQCRKFVSLACRKSKKPIIGVLPPAPHSAA
jgi:hypothetical protein